MKHKRKKKGAIPTRQNEQQSKRKKLEKKAKAAKRAREKALEKKFPFHYLAAKAISDNLKGETCPNNSSGA